MTEEVVEQILIPDEAGDLYLFDVLFKFTVDETNKSYMVLIGEEEEEAEEIDVFPYRFEETAEDDSQEDNEVEFYAFRNETYTDDSEADYKLYVIESDKEWDIVEEMLNTLDDLSEED